MSEQSEPCNGRSPGGAAAVLHRAYREDVRQQRRLRARYRVYRWVITASIALFAIVASIVAVEVAIYIDLMVAVLIAYGLLIDRRERQIDIDNGSHDHGG